MTVWFASKSMNSLKNILFPDRGNNSISVGKSLLITGSHRSGTTWTGKILNTSGVFRYYEEPMNIEKTKDRLGTFDYFFQYIDPDDEKKLNGLVRLKKKAESKNKRALFKDPMAFFAIDAFVNCIGADIVILVRHPAAFASSLKRLDWNFDFKHFLKQKYLMDNNLILFKDEIKLFADSKHSVIEQSILLWNIFYYNALKYKEKYPDIHIIRHEDMAMNPKLEVTKICQHFDIPYTDKMDKYISATSNVNNPVESVNNAIHTLNRNSPGLVKLFQNRLNKQEIDLIKEKTEDISKNYYEASDW